MDELLAHFSGRVVLVTGGHGFIGARVTERLSSLGARVVRLHRRAIPPSNDLAGSSSVEGDLRDPAFVERVVAGADTVLHLAAQTSAKASERDPDGDFAINVDATRHLLDACRRTGRVVRFVLAGTTTQHGKPAHLPLTGAEPDAPLSPYDRNKLLAEQSVELHSRRGEVLGTTLRLPTVYGPGPRASSSDVGVVNAMIRTALAGGPLRVYGTGERLRDFVHVDDVARAFLTAAARIEACSGRHYLVGTGAATRVSDLAACVARAVERIRGIPVEVVRTEPPADEPEIARYDVAIDPAPFERATGFRTEIDLEDGVERTVRHFHEAGETRRGRA
jgi:nucleoside-diphosphate-sugar epimerase